MDRKKQLPSVRLGRFPDGRQTGRPQLPADTTAPDTYCGDLRNLTPNIAQINNSGQPPIRSSEMALVCSTPLIGPRRLTYYAIDHEGPLCQYE